MEINVSTSFNVYSWLQSCNKIKGCLKILKRMVLLSRERRCMSNFVLTDPYKAFHNMQSKIPIDWRTDIPEVVNSNPLRYHHDYQNAYLRNVYNQRIERKMKEKYLSKIDTFRVIPNEITQQKERDILSLEVERFIGKNSTLPLAVQGINNEHYQDPTLNSYTSAREFQNKKNQSQRQQRISSNPQLIYQGSQNQLSLQQTLQKNLPYNSPKSIQKDQGRTQKLGYGVTPLHYGGLYSLQKEFNNDLMKEYRRCAERNPDSLQTQQLKNLMPDKLEYFLRERPRIAGKSRSKLRVSLSHSKRQGSP